jgi:colanic acid/amylovoran biosynthesis glycosyltransferase
MKRVALITSRFPYGPREPFLREEIKELSHVCDIIVVPALPTDEPSMAKDIPSLRLRLLSLAVLRAATCEAMRAPIRSARVLGAVLRAPRTISGKCKNLLIFPTGLAAAHIVRKLGVTHVHAYWLALPATVAYVAAAMNAVPWSATGHRYDLTDSNMSRRNVGNTFISSAQFIRTISKIGERRVRSALGFGARAQLVTEHLGVRVPLAAVVAARRDTTLRLICAAILEPRKGHAVLFDAIATALAAGVRVSCALAGAGSLRAELESRGRALGIADRLHFLGHVAHEPLLAEIQRGTYDAAILTSADEGIPIFLAESMAAGLPVIATRSGGVEELVNGQNGILCSPGQSAEIAAAITALAEDHGLRARLGAAARETVRQRFDVRENARRIAGLLTDVVA